MARKHCHYEVLQVSRSASPEQIAEAYRKLAKQYHPDWHPNDPNASKRFKRLTKAYDVLSDPERRAKYDEKLARRERAANTAAEPPPVQQENTSRTDPPHAQAEQPPAGNATHQTATQSVSILRSWIIALKHFLLRLLTFSSKSLGDARFSFALVVFILAVVAIPASYFVMTYQTPDSEVRSLLARAEVKMQLGDLDEATQLVREATNIKGANNLSAAQKLLDAIAAQQDAAAKAEAEQKAQEVAERKAKEEAEQRAKEEAEEEAKEEAERKAKIEEERRLKQEAEEEAQWRAKIEAEQKAKEERTTRIFYHDNGQKKSEVHWQNGKPDGLATGWYENGQKSSEGNYKNGKKEGLWTSWYENGSKYEEAHYKLDSEQLGQRRSLGLLDGLKTRWFENGQKAYEVHYKDGKRDGFGTRWFENGQKWQERQFKDDVEISRKEF